MKNAVTYLTRHCPRECGYCALRDATNVGKQLTTVQWIQAMQILQKINVEFNLILGNETWILGDELLEIMKRNKVPFALYTTCPEPLFSKFKDKFIGSGIIDNLSCGIDYLENEKAPEIQDDSWRKSQDGWRGLHWVRKNYPDVDAHGNITIHRGNYMYVAEIIASLSNAGIFSAINFIHYNKDGNFDFFPDKKSINHLLFSDEDYTKLKKVLQDILNVPNSRLQNPQYIQHALEYPDIIDMGWHCHGNPYDGPTIDADGSLRVCGYRKGEYTSKYTVFDLPTKENEIQEAIQKDCSDCPGCFWAYPWTYHHLKKHNQDIGTKVYINHAGEDIPKSDWSKRNLE